MRYSRVELIRAALRCTALVCVVLSGIARSQPAAVDVSEIYMTGNRESWRVDTGQLVMTGNREQWQVTTANIVMTGNQQPFRINTQSIRMTGNKGVQEQ